MNKIKENFHIIIIVILLVLIIPIAYYFAFALPSFNREKLRIETQKQEDEMKLKKEQVDAEKAKQDAAELEKMNKESSLSICLSEAETTYHGNWARACKAIADINRESLKTCEGSYCQSLYKVDNSESCSLPSARADSVNGYLKDAKDECFKRYGN